MALLLQTLTNTLENQWLVPQGGAYPASRVESGDHFATAVAGWFQAAQALGFPCATAQARKPQLAAQAAAAFGAGTAQGAGAALAAAVASYLAGQSFGSGVAAFPVALPAAQAALAAAFSDKSASNADRAQQIATACDALAKSTLVAFPNPPFSGPIL